MTLAGRYARRLLAGRPKRRPTAAASVRADVGARYIVPVPSHFHALYNGTEAQIGIDPIIILQGDLPRRAISMVIEWAALHQHELLENWERVCASQPTQKIEPLE